MKTTHLITSALLLFLLIWQNGNAQTSPVSNNHKFRIGAGLDYVNTLDLQYSPNIYHSLRPNLDLSFMKSTGKGIFLMELDVFMGSLKPIGGAQNSVYIEETDINGEKSLDIRKLAYTQMGATFKLGYMHKINAAPGINVLLGGSLADNLTYTPSIIYLGTINYTSLNAEAQLDYGLKNGKSISFGLTLPLVSSVTRMPYHNSPVFPDKTNLAAFFTNNTSTKLINHFQNIKCSIKYNWYLSTKLSLDVKYEASWLHDSTPEHLTVIGNQLSMGLNF